MYENIYLTSVLCGNIIEACSFFVQSLQGDKNIKVTDIKTFVVDCFRTN